LQELSNTHLRLSLADSPDFGRRYEVFYNQARLGTLEVAAMIDSKGKDYSTAANPCVRTYVSLHMVRLLHFDDISELLNVIALHVTDDSSDGSAERLKTRQFIDAAMMKALWSGQQISEYEDLDDQDWGELSLTLYGTPSFYFRRKKAPSAANRASEIA
jgi:hypothetical protein